MMMFYFVTFDPDSVTFTDDLRAITELLYPVCVLSVATTGYAIIRGFEVITNISSLFLFFPVMFVQMSNKKKLKTPDPLKVNMMNIDLNQLSSTNNTFIYFFNCLFTNDRIYCLKM